MSELRNILQPANIQWRDDDLPASADYDDIYFSTADGAAESRYVFLQQNQLEQRWQTPQARFSIGETGFGSGLNFLLTRELWERLQPRSSRLHYISVEQHPMHRDALRRALSRFPALPSSVDELIDQYPPLVSGHHVLHFRQHAITLHLLFGDGEHMLRQMLATERAVELQTIGPSVDAWYLDGFAPRANPALWSIDLCNVVSRLSNEGTTLSTFSAASSVKKNLQAAGFNIKKTAGFGSKRDMLTAVWQRHPPAEPANKKPNSMYDFPRALWYINANTSRSNTVTVLGGGVVGCCSALSLARCGFRVQLLEQGSTLASAASGNAQVALYTRLSPYASPLNDFALAAYLYAVRYYRDYFAHQGQQCGLLQLLGSANEARACTALLAQCDDDEVMRYCESDQAAAIAGIPIDKNAVHFPQSGWLAPQPLCSLLVDHPNIEVFFNTRVTTLHRDGNCWQLGHANAQALQQADNVIVAMGQHSHTFPVTSFLPLRAIRGQVSYVQATPVSNHLRTVICDRSFITPPSNDLHTIGASYNQTATDRELSQQDHRNNMQQLSALLPAMAPASSAPLKGRVGFRCVAPDYLPVVGPVPERAAFEHDYAALAKDAKQTVLTVPQHLPGLYVNSAYGSRAYCFAPLCAELLASQVSGELPPLPAYITRALLPGRFMLRKIIHAR